MRLADWADLQGISRLTAYRWYQQGKLPHPAYKINNTILIDTQPQPTPTPQTTAIYARVSSHDQQTDLDRQIARLATWAAQNNHKVDKIVTEIGSALNGSRRKFTTLLQDPTITTIIVEHRDRYCRFGHSYIEAALAAQNRHIIVVDQSEIDDDLVRDTIDILTSLCARIYGKRSAADRKARIAQAVGLEQ